VLFGFATIMQGLVKSYSGLLATRFFLGVFGTLLCQPPRFIDDLVLTQNSQRLAW
jgi:hypothetical protein